MNNFHLWKLNKNIFSKFLWISLLIISFIGLFLMWLSVFIKLLIVKDFVIWYELLIIPFYFTHVSNIMAFILSFVVVFKLVNHVEFIRRFLIFTVANLMLTLIVFWITFLSLNLKYSKLNLISTIFIHLITPILMLFIFFWTVFKENKYKHKLSSFQDSIYHLSFLVGWILISIIPLNFLLKLSKYSYIYKILLNDELYLNVIFAITIVVLYFLITWLIIWISNYKIQSKK